MSPSKPFVITAILTIVLGICWLMNVQQIMTPVDWIKPGIFASVGLTIIYLSGINKLSLLIGLSMLTEAILIVTTQAGTLPRNYEFPIILITVGSLALILVLLPIPWPWWMKESRQLPTSTNDPYPGDKQ